MFLKEKALPHLPTLVSFGAIQSAQMLLSFLTLPWLAHRLGPESFGLFMYMGLIAVIAALIMDWGFPQRAARKAAFRRNGKRTGT